MDSHSPQPSRRDVLRGALAAGASLTLAGSLSACGSRSDAPRTAGGDQWRQFKGATLNFISENTAPTAAIAADLRPFTDLTGINVNIVTLELTALVQRVALDLASGRAQYQVVYADPYQVLAPYQRGLVDLRSLQADPGLPDLPGGVTDFIPTQLDAAGRFVEPGPIYALPYDAPTMIWQYRSDLFGKYHDRMADDLGFDPAPGGDRTWEEYFGIARWFNKNATSDVKYGTGHQARQHDSLMNDFSNVLWSYGGDYFANGREVGRMGSRDPGPCRLDSEAAIAGAEFYNRLLGIADPASKTWDWDGVGAAFRAGRLAMCPNWHEYAASNELVLPGKVGYAPLPRGPAGTANMYGGTGVAISANTLAHERGAAWLFLVWATSPQTQLANLRSKAGGGTPTRTSVYELPEVRAAEKRPSPMPNMLTAAAVRQAWQADRIGLRPKIPMWNECNTAIFTQLSRMLTGGASPEEAMRSITSRVDRIVARGWVA
ncbi:extracellular solute-binding protein [Streptosporangium roseum]|uniref:Extracellular solute-binding protein, family 1 n=1 Tax=Streptosporangium roseum (strain ATCC 12428 / DSM 43021 / JCM 3005 / KCTC 9067 / NCIMB 10171 / NRRL 2505 / NI 9100) TaxID=479432 RepID=D2AQN4_STRRD|nr:extracellular solute-binding protein [Streptosporangium roseum]ACZ86431.1 extracellular solute-binding protein, family 1 [Streptosporangium roseum DSM 43021]